MTNPESWVTFAGLLKPWNVISNQYTNLQYGQRKFKFHTQTHVSKYEMPNRLRSDGPIFYQLEVKGHLIHFTLLKEQRHI